MTYFGQLVTLTWCESLKLTFRGQNIQGGASAVSALRLGLLRETWLADSDLMSAFTHPIIPTGRA